VPPLIVDLDRDPSAAQRAVVAALRAGQVVVLPTDTIYGIVARAHDPDAVASLFSLKGRDPSVPVAVLCADAAQALALVEPAAVTAAVTLAAERGWPGALTLVLPRRADVALALGEPETTIGVRCPDHAFVQAVAREVGPLAATSANLHGQPTPVDAEGVADELGEGIAVVVDAGRLEGKASTVIDATLPVWRVLREGAVSAADLTDSP
jgi:tRNA threonylcarbamoyl adenosine modification protein (Sua5/YciO/YrdC/YwlC family)